MVSFGEADYRRRSRSALKPRSRCRTPLPPLLLPAPCWRLRSLLLPRLPSLLRYRSRSLLPPLLPEPLLQWRSELRPLLPCRMPPSPCRRPCSAPLL